MAPLQPARPAVRDQAGDRGNRRGRGRQLRPHAPRQAAGIRAGRWSRGGSLWLVGVNELILLALAELLMSMAACADRHSVAGLPPIGAGRWVWAARGPQSTCSLLVRGLPQGRRAALRIRATSCIAFLQWRPGRPTRLAHRSAAARRGRDRTGDARTALHDRDLHRLPAAGRPGAVARNRRDLPAGDSCSSPASARGSDRAPRPAADRGPARWRNAAAVGLMAAVIASSSGGSAVRGPARRS